MATPISSDILNQEVDARFWAQTGFKPGHKLDPNNPTDKAMASVWMHIFRELKPMADKGTLVTTFDHPVVSQALSDAEVAGRAAAVHVAAAAQTPDSSLAQDHVAAATTASQVSAQRSRDAAAVQPPTVNPEIVRRAGQAAAQTPPPPQAAPAEHIAHAHARDHAHTHARRVHAQARAVTASREALYKETNKRFWDRTNYKPGQNLDMAIEQDRQMAKVWMSILHEVEAEKRTFPGFEPSSSQAGPSITHPPVVAPPTTTFPLPGAPRPSMGRPPTGPSTGPLRPGRPSMWPQMWPWRGSSMAPMGPPRGPSMGPPSPPRGPSMGPPSPPRGPSMSPSRGPSMAPMGPSMSPHEPTGSPAGSPGGPLMGPPETPTPGAPGGSPSGAPSPGEPSPGASDDASSHPEESSSLGKYIAIGLAVIAGGGLLYYATTRLPAPKPPSRSRARRASVSPRIPRAVSAAMARSMPAQGGSELELEE